MQPLARSLVVAAVALVAVAAGCSGGGSQDVAKAPPPAAKQRRAGSKPRHKDPYTASVQYVGCMREHGIDLPDPKPNGDIQLTPEQDRRLSPKNGEEEAEHSAADNACFHFLRGAVKTKPLSKAARGRMAKVMVRFARCMRRKGYVFGKPVVRNISRGRVILFFPHEAPALQQLLAARDPKLLRAQTTCERGQTQRLDKAIGNER